MADRTPGSAVQNQSKSIRCASCERQLVIAYRPSPVPHVVATSVACPFCDHETMVELDGPVVSVSGHDQRKPQ